jgi:hypothetical protein
MRSSLKFLIVILLGIPVTASAQLRPAKCEVQPLWVGGGVRSSNFGLMGAFEKDGSEGEVIRSFNLKDTNLVATVGIDYDFDYSKYKMHRIRLAIIISDRKQKKIFESVDSSEARTLYRKGWNLSVTKNVNLGNLVYIFTLRCWDSTAFAGKRPFL